MRRIGVAVAALAVLAAGLVPVAATAGTTPGRPRTPAVASPDHRPRTIPALRRWTPSAGRWHLTRGSRIVTAYHARGLAGEARQLSHDLAPVIGRRLPVVSHGAGSHPGDIVLDRHSSPVHGYVLRVGSELVVRAESRIGAFYGGRSIIQLLAQHRWIHHGRAADWPAYKQRGLMVDCSRTVYSTGWILREIRELALLKLNLLHLHLTDDQRWGVESKAFPEIVSPHAFTYADIHRILRVARRYHVHVFPEIDMPGHMAAFLAKHPALTLQPELVGSTGQPQQYLTDKLDITKPVVRRDVKKMVLEYMKLFPGRYFDMGDDEVLPPPEVAVFPQLEAYAVQKYGPGATASDALHGFINWVDGIVRRHGKVLRIWNDQLGGTGVVPVNRDITVDWWTEFSPLGDTLSLAPKTLLAQGFKIVNAGWYPNYYASDIGPSAGKAEPARVYQDWHVYEFDGEADQNGDVLTEAHVPSHDPRVLGDAMSIWGPLPETTAQTASGIAPRLAVIAQKSWRSRPPTATYAAFARLMRRVGVT